MSNNPLVKFGDVVHLNTSRLADPAAAGIERYVGLEHITPEDLQVHSWGLVADGTTFTSHFQPGQVLFGKRRAYQRKVAVADFEGVCSSDIYIFEPRDPEVLLPELLPFICQSEGFFEYALHTSAGSLSPRTRWSDLANYEFPIPPLDEQHRIANLLRAMDDVIVQDKNLCEKLRVYRKALVADYFERELAYGCKIIKLGDLMLKSPESGHSPISTSTETGHYVLILSALSPNGYLCGYLKPVELTPEVQKTKLKTGDFLISRSNTIELVGLIGIFNENREDISFPDTMIRLVLDESRINKQFLEQFLLSKSARRQIQHFAAGTSGSMKKINRSHIAALQIPLLSLDEQNHIVRASHKLTDAIVASEGRLSKSNDLKQAILNKTLIQ